MRWLFADPQNAAEAAYRRKIMSAIDAWWRSFQQRAPDIERVFSRQSKMDLPEWMHETLGGVHPAIMWEFGRALRGSGHRLVITPEMNHHLRPLVRTLLERAPRMPGWEFYDYRLPEDCEQAMLAVEGRVGVKLNGARIAAAATRSRKIDLSYFFPPELRLSDEKARHAAFIASEVLFGEQALDAWIGAINVIDPLNRDPKRRLLPLERGQETVAALISSLTEQLPERPFWERPTESDEDIWTSFQLQRPENAEDYAEREDYMFGTTRWMPLIETVHSGQLFGSSCHSRHAETFCYLKLDAAEIPSEHLVDFRSQFEEAIHSQLALAQAGGIVGGGTGLRYSYIDLAVTDLKLAIPLLQRLLASREAPLRSWLLFFDGDLRGEWVGIYPDTPAPPEWERPTD